MLSNRTSVSVSAPSAANSSRDDSPEDTPPTSVAPSVKEESVSMVKPHSDVVTPIRSRRSAAKTASAKLSAQSRQAQDEDVVPDSEEDVPLAKRPGAGVNKGKARAISLSSDEAFSEGSQFAPSDHEDVSDGSVMDVDAHVNSDADMDMDSEVDSVYLKPARKPSKPIKRATPKTTTTARHAQIVISDEEVTVPTKTVKKVSPSKKSKASQFGSIANEDDVSDQDSELSSELSDLDDDEDVPLAQVTKAKGKKGGGKKKVSLKGMSHALRNQYYLELHHPELIGVWGDLEKKVKIVEPIKAPQPEAIAQTLLPFQLEGLYWMKQQEAGAWKGGILADEMGMGKTIQTISLICSDHDPNATGAAKKLTLVIAPTVAIIQWRNEFEKFTKGFKVVVWHGASRATDLEKLKQYDVVLTSYAVLQSVYSRQNKGFMKNKVFCKESSPLHKIKWHRIILDEAHNIKDRACNTAKATFALRAKYRWCLSGTPLQNRVGELYSLIRFLGVLPFAANFCKKCPCRSLHWNFPDKRACADCGHTPMQHVWFWNNEILKPIQRYGHLDLGETAFKKLHTLLDRMLLRRTKVERADDMSLPPRTIAVRRDYFTEEEEELYTSLYSDVKRNFETYVDAGTVLNNYGNIFTLITRMRQCAMHADLVLKSRTASVREMLNNGNDEYVFHTCRICLDEAEEPIMSKCRHVFCRECIRNVVEGCGSDNMPECNVCHAPLVINLEGPALDEGVDRPGQVAARQGMLDRIDPSKWRSSTKIEALVEELTNLRAEDHSAKALVFSQSTSFLDLIARRLQLSGFKIARLQGSMTPEQRDRTVKYFMENTDVTVFILSIKAGGVALNLVEANHVYICDPWWNPAVELQAMDRIHRIGQKRPVYVKRLIIENSIESRILELQKKKESMTQAALGDDSEALGRLTPEDLRFLFTL